MERQRLDSSSVASAGYDPDEHVLEVEFRNGGVYQYVDVPDAEYRRFMNAESKGRYLNSRIKTRFPVRKLRPARGR